MTARRRRKSGSGPSATALIAWVGGEGVVAGQRVGPGFSKVSGVRAAGQTGVAPPRASLVARSRGLVAGALLACGSVLAVAVHAADSSWSSSGSDPLPELVTAGPGAMFSGNGATSLAMVRSAVASSGAAAASMFRTNRIRSGPVVRNTPLALNSMSVPATTRQPPTERPTAEQSLPLSVPGAAASAAPASDPVERASTPMARVMRQPVLDVATRVDVLAAPVDDLGAQPAMTMLSPRL